MTTSADEEHDPQQTGPPEGESPEAEPSEGEVGSDAPRRRLGAVIAVALLVLAGLGVREVLVPGPRPPSPPGSWTLVPYRGLGAWVDVYDWTAAFGGATPAVGTAQIDAMAKAGVQTVFLQTAGARTGDVLEPKQLDALIDRAHARHLHVVAWYLPTLTDVAQDERRLEAAAALRVDGLAVDIEATDVVDVTVRNQRLVDLSRTLRARIDPKRVISAVTLSPVHLEVVNPAYWTDYPWKAIGTSYDAILPMAYWTIRLGDLRNGERYITQTIDRIRIDTGRSDLPIHVIGGIADAASTTDLAGMVRAIGHEGAIGGSLYDWHTSNPSQWTALQPLRSLRPPTP